MPGTGGSLHPVRVGAAMPRTSAIGTCGEGPMARSRRKRLRREQAMGQWGGACRATRGRPGVPQC